MRDDRKRQAAMERHRMRRKAHVKTLRRSNDHDKGWTPLKVKAWYRRPRY